MSYPCNINKVCQHLTWISHTHTHTLCAFQDPPRITFFQKNWRTEEDSASFLPMCLCRSWLQMCLCRRSLDLRRAAAGALVRTALWVASFWTPKAVASPRWLFKSLLCICLSGMTWTQCRSLICGRRCPTLTCHIFWVAHVCGDPRGNMNLLLCFLFSERRFLLDQKHFFFQDAWVKKFVSYN